MKTLKVVIPSLYYRRKKWRFLSPRRQFEVPDHNIRGKTTSDNPFEAPNVKLLLGIASSQQVLTKVAKIVKIATSEKHIFWPKTLYMSMIFKLKCFDD